KRSRTMPETCPTNTPVFGSTSQRLSSPRTEVGTFSKIMTIILHLRVHPCPYLPVAPTTVRAEPNRHPHRQLLLVCCLLSTEFHQCQARYAAAIWSRGTARDTFRAHGAQPAGPIRQP